jgi:hypothetical protein
MYATRYHIEDCFILFMSQSWTNNSTFIYFYSIHNENALLLLVMCTDDIESVSISVYEDKTSINVRWLRTHWLFVCCLDHKHRFFHNATLNRIIRVASIVITRRSRRKQIENWRISMNSSYLENSRVKSIGRFIAEIVQSACSTVTLTHVSFQQYKWLSIK